MSMARRRRAFDAIIKKSMARIDWTPALKEKFREEYYSGKSYKEIGKAFGITDKNVYARARTLINEGFMKHRSELPLNGSDTDVDKQETVSTPTPKEKMDDNNPFEIKTDMSRDIRGDRIMLVNALVDKVLEMDPKNKNMSLVITKDVCETQNSAAGLVGQLRRLLEGQEHLKHVGVSLKTIKDINGKYVETRIWRVS